MKKIIFVSSLLLSGILSPSLAQASCDDFRGHYVVSAKGCYHINHGVKYSDNLYTGIQITVDNTYNVSMFYEEGSQDHGFTTSYIADSKQHQGDVNNTGKSYVATCDDLQIHSVRDGLLIAPVDMTFAKNSDQTFTLTETVTTQDPFVRSCNLEVAR